MNGVVMACINFNRNKYCMDISTRDYYICMYNIIAVYTC